MPLSNVKPAQLYHHILAHSDVFGMQTLELRPTRTQTPSSGTTMSDICLHINVCPESLGPTTSLQLSKLLQDAQECYAIHVIAVCEEKNQHCLNLVFYLLLVNINDRFPRRTRDASSHGSSLHPDSQYVPTRAGPSPEDPVHELDSELHLSVKKHRLKLGLDPLLRPSSSSSSASRLVQDDSLVREHMQSLQGHFEGIVKNALHHMRRDELWKRMLYGRHRTEPTKPSVVQVSLSIILVVRVNTVAKYFLSVRYLAVYM